MNILDQIMGVEEAAELWRLTPGTIKNYCASGRVISKKIGKTWVIVKDQKNPKQVRMSEMRVWEREGYTVEEKAFDHDLHEFDVVKGGEVIATITPGSIEDMEYIIEDLESGADVNGWDDGNGNTITVQVKIDPALIKTNKNQMRMNEIQKYVGYVIDRMNALETKKTKAYDTYAEAHKAAEKLCKRTYGERGTIEVKTV